MSSTKISQGNRKKYKTKRKFAKVFQNTNFSSSSKREIVSHIAIPLQKKNSTISSGKTLDIKHKKR